MRETVESAGCDRQEQEVVLWGATGQAKVLRPVIEGQGLTIACLYDRDPSILPPFDDVLLIGDMTEFEIWLEANCVRLAGFAVAIGGGHGCERLAVAGKLSSFGLDALTLVHERAWVADTALLGDGCQILAMAAISEEARLGRQCIVNTNASVDHECVLGAGVHVMPGATLAGCVKVGDCAMIGSGATVLPHITIGADAVIGAGAVVTRDVREGEIVVGVPARARIPETRLVSRGLS